MEEKIYRPIRPKRKVQRDDSKEIEVSQEVWDEVCPKIEELLMFLDSKGVALHCGYDNRHYFVEKDFPSRRLDR